MAKYDADYFTKDCFAEKFEFLLNVRYSKLDEHKRRGQFENDYSEYYLGNIHSSVSQWFSRRQKPSIEKLMNICELLDCDMDYFLTDQKVFKKDTAHASETTGLRYETIEILEKIKKCYIKPHTIDELINHNDFRKLIQYIWEYAHSQNNEIVVHDTVGEKPSKSYTGAAQKELMKYRASEVFGSILDDIILFIRRNLCIKRQTLFYQKCETI